MRSIGIGLFAGAGGLTPGFETAGFDIAATVEIDPMHCAMHEFSFPHCKTICRNRCRLASAAPRLTFDRRTEPTPVHQRTLELLGM